MDGEMKSELVQIHLTPSQLERLKGYAAESRKIIPEYLRDLIDEGIIYKQIKTRAEGVRVKSATYEEIDVTEARKKGQVG